MTCLKLNIPENNFATLKVVRNFLENSANSSAETYRFGFNGKETDPETNTQDYGFRIYNPALGRFLP